MRFDLNDYSIPHTKVQRLLTVLADPNEVRIVDVAPRGRPDHLLQVPVMQILGRSSLAQTLMFIANKR